jgi:hypothetical protein
LPSSTPNRSIFLLPSPSRRPLSLRAAATPSGRAPGVAGAGSNTGHRSLCRYASCRHWEKHRRPLSCRSHRREEQKATRRSSLLSSPYRNRFGEGVSDLGPPPPTPILSPLSHHHLDPRSASAHGRGHAKRQTHKTWRRPEVRFCCTLSFLQFFPHLHASVCIILYISAFFCNNHDGSCSLASPSSPCGKDSRWTSCPKVGCRGRIWLPCGQCLDQLHHNYLMILLI